MVMVYVGFPLTLRNVEDLLFERRIDITYETVWLWWSRFGPLFDADIRRGRVSQMLGFRNWRWHPDEVYVKIGAKLHYLWRAVDHEGKVLECFVTRKSDKAAAFRFQKKALKRHDRAETIVTDGLKSYPAAMRDLGDLDRHVMGGRLNNQAENSHLLFRRRECPILRFRQFKTLQKFTAVHASIYNQFNTERHLINRPTCKARRSAAVAKWQAHAA